jgi:hypothetical protein
MQDMLPVEGIPVVLYYFECACLKRDTQAVSDAVGHAETVAETRAQPVHSALISLANQPRFANEGTASLQRPLLSALIAWVTL